MSDWLRKTLHPCKSVYVTMLLTNGEITTIKRISLPTFFTNTDNLSEAKFKKYVAKAEIEFEESIKLTGKTAAIEKNSTDGVLTFTQLVKEWKTSVLQNLSRNYYGRICVTEKLFTSFLVEHHLADKYKFGNKWIVNYDQLLPHLKKINRRESKLWKAYMARIGIKKSVTPRKK